MGNPARRRDFPVGRMSTSNLLSSPPLMASIVLVLGAHKRRALLRSLTCCWQIQPFLRLLVDLFCAVRQSRHIPWATTLARGCHGETMRPRRCRYHLLAPPYHLIDGHKTTAHRMGTVGGCRDRARRLFETRLSLATQDKGDHDRGLRQCNHRAAISLKCLAPLSVALTNLRHTCDVKVLPVARLTDTLRCKLAKLRART